jgi:pimeloyl-ACP methyl ester carboxylesterase
LKTQPFRIELTDNHYIVGDSHNGSGPAYVFLHGLGSARVGEKSESLREHALTQNRGFLRFDMRGHGESSGQLGEIAVTALVADTIRVLEDLGSSVLIGSSLGGLVATHVAAARPDLVDRLALLAPAFGLMPTLRQRLDKDGYMKIGENIHFHVKADVLADAEQLDERTLPARLKVPTLLVHGTSDDVIPQVVSELFFAQMSHKQKQLWIVPDGDHRLNMVAEQIWQRIDEQPMG